MPDKSKSDQTSRRQNKALRRQKQREANLGRAQKMHKARLENPIKPIIAKKYKNVSKFQIGCSGWFYWDWRKIFYPENMPTKQWFDHYASQFSTVELNAPFYSWPTVGTAKGWARQAENRQFLFTVKVCELITHVKRFQGTRKLIEDFCYIGDILGPRMGCFLFQLPPSYKYTPARLKNILGQLDHNRRNAIEFRHQSWWNKRVYDAFRKTNTIFCSCSAPKLPDELIETSDDVYIRFHGKEKWYRHDYSDEELKLWKVRIEKCGAKRFWIYFNNDFNGHAIKNARRLEQLLKIRRS